MRKEIEKIDKELAEIETAINYYTDTLRGLIAKSKYNGGNDTKRKIEIVREALNALQEQKEILCAKRANIMRQLVV